MRTLKLKILGKVVDRRKALRTTVAVTTVLAFIKLHIFATASLTLLTAIYLPIGIVLWTDYFLTYKGWKEVRIGVGCEGLRIVVYG
ncbi:MAG: hypothetical protein B7O98_09250 [Zestosphaera tikiterensis]|uniref:Uncharacterized protein n=1 Tax=Zestosphaera tikiterensis TaxID=1973259 RepID=A0A2R7Y1R1_9CREN|nr:MAG: hypothetical protein B7O98_09250 [Zestosphaera tikiterensis]